MLLHDAVGINCEKGTTTENQGADVLGQPVAEVLAYLHVSADLTNQLQSCWVDPACAWKKH